MYVVSGTLHVEQNGHFVLKSGEGIIMRLTDKHKYYTDTTDICEVLWMHFGGKQCETFLKLIEKIRFMPTVFKIKSIENIIKTCYSIITDDNSETEFLISQTIYTALLSITHNVCKEAQIRNVSPQAEFRNKANKYIDNNIYQKVTLKDFADQFSVSPYHFCRIFQRIFDMTPMHYVLMKKIELSKYLLTYTNESLSSIAITLGFTDQSHFSKTFRHFHPKSPIEFRKMGL